MAAWWWRRWRAASGEAVNPKFDFFYDFSKSFVMLGNCRDGGVTSQNFSRVELTFLKILWRCRILIENALGLRKSVLPGQWDRV